MGAIETISGHVARAVDFFNVDNMWMVLGRPYDWNIARLTGYNVGPSFVTVTPHTLTFVVNDTYTVSYTVTGTKSATTIASEINTAANLVHSSLATMASVSGNRIRLTSPTLTTGKIEITSGSTILGFFVGDKEAATVGGDTVPTTNPVLRRVLEPFAYVLIDTKALVIPDADTPASIVSVNHGTVFDTSGDSGANVFEFTVDGSSTITVTFPDSASTSLSVIVDYINDAANGVSADYAEVASVDGSVSPARLKLTSPTVGTDSTLVVTTASPVASLDIATQTVLGTDGGYFKFRSDQFSGIEVEDAYDEGARMVYVEGEFLYDQVALNSYSQIGLVTNITFAAGVPSNRTYLSGDEVATIGILEYLENRKLTSRSSDQKELIRLVIEF